MTFAASQDVGNPYAPVYILLFITGLVTAGLTAFYTFRAYFRTFWGHQKLPHEAGHHAHGGRQLKSGVDADGQNDRSQEQGQDRERAGLQLRTLGDCLRVAAPDSQ